MYTKNARTLELKARLDMACSEVAPSDIMTNIHKWERDHTEIVLKKYGRFIEQFETYYDTLVKGLHAVNYIPKETWPKHRGVQFIIASHNLKSLYSSFDRLIKGFYEDSQILIRVPYEGLIKSFYIECHPEDPYGVVANKMENRKFNLTNFLKLDLKLDWTDYHLQSSWAHANQYSVLKKGSEISKSGQQDAITMTFGYDDDMFTIGVNHIQFVALCYMKFLDEFFSGETNSTYTVALKERVHNLSMLARESMGQHPKDYWKKVARDTDNIFALMRALQDDRSDWKKTWTRIRRNQ